MCHQDISPWGTEAGAHALECRKFRHRAETLVLALFLVTPEGNCGVTSSILSLPDEVKHLRLVALTNRSAGDGNALSSVERSGKGPGSMFRLTDTGRTMASHDPDGGGAASWMSSHLCLSLPEQTHRPG